MRKFYLIVSVMLILLHVSCSDDEEPLPADAIVVEGWIENGRFPIVQVTHSVVISSDYQPLDSLERYMERWARVRLSDGEREVTMMGRYDREYFPPFIYTTMDMRGEPGRTYRLTVDTPDGSHAEASATIPEPVEIDSLVCERVGQTDTLRQLYCYITDRGPETSYYKVFVHIMGRPYGYTSSSLGIVTTDMLPSNGKIAVNQGRVNLEKDYIQYFATGDEVVVKVCRMDRTGYEFWRDFEDMTSLSRNPFFPVTDNIRSNITGGLGYWLGYGSSVRRIIIE